MLSGIGKGKTNETGTTATPVHWPLCEGDAGQAGQGETREQAASTQRRAKGKVRMHETVKRRVHIKGGRDLPIGWKVTIEDAETGEMITNITKAVITLLPGEYNAVEFTYMETDEKGQLLVNDGEPIEKHTRINFPEIDLDAYEIETKESLEELKARIIALGQSQPNEY